MNDEIRKKTQALLEAVNPILTLLQNIDDAYDANEFVRIMLDALENSAEHCGEDFPRDEIAAIITSIDKRIKSDS